MLTRANAAFSRSPASLVVGEALLLSAEVAAARRIVGLRALPYC